LHGVLGQGNLSWAKTVLAWSVHSIDKSWTDPLVDDAYSATGDIGFRIVLAPNP
jgi:hypothetical protein